MVNQIFVVTSTALGGRLAYSSEAEAFTDIHARLSAKYSHNDMDAGVIEFLKKHMRRYAMDMMYVYIPPKPTKKQG